MHTLKIVKQDDQTAIVGGYGVVFGGQDLEGETFNADTDYMLDLVPRKLVFIDHSLGSDFEIDGKSYALKGIDEPVGEVIRVEPDDTGLYMELMFNKADRYWNLVEAMVNSGKAGLSSGAIGHLTRRDGGLIKRWPIVEESITLTPAEPRTIGVERLKALVEAEPSLKAIIPEAAGKTATNEATAGSVEAATIEIIGESDMEEITNVAAEPQENAEVKALSEKVDAILAALNERKGVLADAGYWAPDDEKTKPEAKSFGDWLMAVKNRNHKRLTGVYNSQKDLQLNTGEAGGYLVPEEYANQLLQVAAMSSVIEPRVTRVPVSRDTGRYPVLDQYVTPSAGSGATALAAGITAATTAAGGTLTETQNTFEQIQWNVHKIGGYVEVENELIADSAFAIESLLRQLFGVAIAARNERNILRGTGQAEPVGILNSGAAVSVTVDTNATFAYADALEMLARFKSVGGQPVWLIHPGIWPDIGVFEVGTGGAVWQNNPQGAMGASLLGYPILQSEHLPQDDNAGCVILADLSAYLFFVRSELSIAFSEHAAFLTDKGTWRFLQRNDGQPWLRNPITLADPQGSYTVSPFVYLND